MADEKKSGSPNGEPIYLAVGFFRRPHGLQGELIMDLHTDFPERLKAGRKIYVGDENETFTIASVRAHGKGVLIKLRGFDSPETAGRFRNQWARVKSDEIPALPEGRYYKHELIGARVVADDGETLGVLNEILETGANDVYIVRRDDGKEILLPAIPDVILNVNIDEKIINVHLIEGLLDI
ncbi:MAG: ribosome maturation factor RimM [Anaerolineales bacterium]|nr:ribosome maturation factor RimM [Anaerolineales bacterium]